VKERVDTEAHWDPKMCGFWVPRKGFASFKGTGNTLKTMGGGGGRKGNILWMNVTSKGNCVGRVCKKR